MADLFQAYQMCIGVFKQDTSGSAYNKLSDADYKLTKWNVTSILPVSYKFTNFNYSGRTVETTSTPYITDLSKTAKFMSGVVTPGTVSLNLERPLDVADILATLDAVTGSGIEDRFRVLFAVGFFASEATSTRTYSIIMASCAVATGDGGANAEAAQTLTSTLNLQLTGAPTMGSTANNATMTWNTTTGVVTLVPPSGT